MMNSRNLSLLAGVVVCLLVLAVGCEPSREELVEVEPTLKVEENPFEVVEKAPEVAPKPVTAEKKVSTLKLTEKESKLNWQAPTILTPPGGLSEVFPDLCYWRGYYYLLAKRGVSKTHTIECVIAIRRSTDAVNWQEVATIPADDPGFRIAGPSFAPCRDYLAIISNPFPIKKRGGRYTALRTSTDGINWTNRTTVIDPWQVWRPRFHQGYWYGGADSDDTPTVNRVYRSVDCNTWEQVAAIDTPPYHSTETSFFFLPDGRLSLYIRKDPQEYKHLYAEAAEPFGSWTVSLKDVCVEGLQTAALGERALGFGRQRWLNDPTGRQRYMALWWLDEGEMRKIDLLPSPGECSGANGFVQTGPDQGLIAYYANPGPLKVYLAPITWQTEGPYIDTVSAPLPSWPLMEVDDIVLPRPSGTGTDPSHQPHLVLLEGKLYATWSVGVTDANSNEQVYISSSTDGLSWSTPQVLASDPDGPTGPVGQRAGGLYVDIDGGNLVAYYTTYDNTVPSAEVKARVSADGGTWGSEQSVASGLFVNHSPSLFGPTILAMAGTDANGQPKVLRSDDLGGVSGWEEAGTLFDSNHVGLSSPTIYTRWNDAAILLMSDSNDSGKVYGSMSTDWGRNWSSPLETEISSSPMGLEAGDLPSGTYRAYMVSTPNDPTVGNVLALSVSYYGVEFSRAWVLKDDLGTVIRDWQPTDSLAWNDELYIACETDEGEVSILRSSIASW